MKRSIKNKLISQICFMLIILCTFVHPGFAWRILIGPMNEFFSTFILIWWESNQVLMPFLELRVKYDLKKRFFKSISMYLTWFDSWYKSRQIVAVAIVLSFTEIILFKVLMLFDWNYFCSMDEDYLSRVFNFLNFSFGFVTQISRWILGSFQTHGFEVLNDILLNNLYSERIFWSIFLSVNCSIIIIGTY